jgi:hypothetical protein
MPAHKKDPSVRARANTASTARTLTPTTGRKRIPPLPKRSKGDGWHVGVRTWWSAVWRSPMAPEYAEVDRHALQLLAFLMHDFYTAGSAGERQRLASEIRLQRAAFGQTPYDRLRLEWTIGAPDQVPAGAAVPRPATGVPQGSDADDPRRGLHAV